MKTALIIGGGFAGCAAAHQLTLQGGFNVTLVESAPHLGAGVRTQWEGGHPYTFGPRHFLTQNEAVFSYLNAIVPIRRCPEHEFLTYVEEDADFYSYPINVSDIARMPDGVGIEKELLELSGVEHSGNLEEYWIRSVGPTLYSKFIDRYSKKMWRVEDNTEIDTFSWSPKGVTLKEGARAAWDSAISGYPFAPNGYDDYFDYSTASANVKLNTRITRFDIPKKRIQVENTWHSFDLIVNTISPDLLFQECYGPLPFIGRDFYPIVLPIEFAFPKNVYFVYYANAQPFTRIVEYKKFTHHSSASTLIGLEIPSLNGRHYPLPIKAEQRRAERYFEEMPEDVFSIGRAGSYDYSVDIDDCIEQAMGIREKIG